MNRVVHAVEALYPQQYNPLVGVLAEQCAQYLIPTDTDNGGQTHAYFRAPARARRKTHGAGTDVARSASPT